ncbi:H(+)-transporting two-sector ATPase [Beutenbergia cavernae DSM 12333]|uniref:H(+)-transporting two-sector ATPase n=1 Tax=Beutenbergia cavernae (strain ATCC BAA-8 / DSM 12333 / CCUG 43141 / JCM 11478 / NBRC 16432 / NCIMB 13614 / HKI 0122) TaxID=471853 RepID=C5C1A2_BEUC1|nr:potassium transporter TrkG [Beutenbergia cavernae]ACQ81512.1 H(+)-transporting two-sector ATPase [Beutenbergia cavernae DSM 12333]
MEVPAVLQAARDTVDRVARRSPARLALATFASVVAIATALLSLPAATTTGERAPFADAVFTATSAVCVTGLVSVDTATFWSPFGQVVIMIAIQIGGLGVMTLASILGLAVSRRIGLTQRLLTASETKTTRLGEVGSLIRAVIAASLTLEILLALVLVPRFLTLGEELGQAMWHGSFLAVSTFNNAGFVIIEGGMSPYVGDWWMCLPIIVGTFIGAVGFPVILNVAQAWRRPRRFTLHTKLTLTTHAALAATSVLIIGGFEWFNDRTFGGLPVADRILASLFAGIMPRSSGFSTVDVGEMREATWFMTDALMFVGGGSASTAGGIKVSTLAVMLLAIVAEARGDRDVEAFGRRIDRATLRLAVAVSFIGATLVGIATLALLTITDLPLDVILFEVISAFATCGLSTGITPTLPDSAHYVLSALMFAGRTGTMTLAAALALRSRRRVIRLPDERPIIG